MSKHAIVRALIIFIISAIFRTEASALVRSFEGLTRLVSDERLTSVEQVLWNLDTELRRNYSVGFATRSNQAASFSNPRIILFSKTAEFLLTFNGNSKQRGGDVLEIISYDPITRRPTFGSIDFAAGYAKVSTARESALCRACHSSHPSHRAWALMEAHPIWDSYPHWPDRFGGTHGSGHRYSLRLQLQWSKFKRIARNHPRYGALVDLQGKSLAEMSYLNNRLGNALFERNAEKALSYVMSSKHYPRYAEAWRDLKFAHLRRPFASTLSRLPEEEQQSFLNERPKLLHTITEGMDAYYRSKVERVREFEFGWKTSSATRWKSGIEEADLNPRVGDFDAELIPIATRIRFLLERSELSPEIFNMTLERNSWSSRQGSRGLNNLGLYFDRIACSHNLVSGR